MRREEKLNDYDGFVEKFKPKKTTDDCYTPQEIYETVKKYVCNRWNVDPDYVVRPFWHGGDYESFDYHDGAVVIDNPPFSILAKIQRFYIGRCIPFFLFAPSLTLLSGMIDGVNHIVCDCNIVYENGANVRTSFVSSFGYPTVLESCPELTNLVNDKMTEILKRERIELPKYSYPNELVTAAMAQRYAKYGVYFSVDRNNCEFVRALDSQRAVGKAVFGGGLLLSSSAAAERAAAERAAAERAAAHVWELSARERDIVRGLSGGEE